MRYVTVFVAGSLALVARGAAAQTIPPETITDYPSSGVQLGNGWDSKSSQKTTAVCVVAASATDPGQHKYITYTDVTDSSSMMKALSISAEAKIASLTGAGASASLKFSRETTLTTSGANVVVNALILEGATYVVPPQGKLPAQQTLDQNAAPTVTNARPDLAFLNQGAVLLKKNAARLARRNPTAFRQQCGDYFVSMIRNASGVEGVVSANTRNESEKTSASAAIKGTYGIASGNVAATQTMESMESQGRVSIQYHQIGGAGTVISTTPEAFRKLIVDIAPIADTETSAPHHIGLMSYKRLANYRSSFATNPDMEVMANQYYRLETIRRQLYDAISHPQNYLFNDKVPQNTMNSLATAVQQDMNKLSATLGKCANQPKNCRYPAGVARQDYDYRSRMPLPQVAAADWTELKAAQDGLPAAVAAHAATPPQLGGQRHCVTWILGVCTNFTYHYPDNPQFAATQATIDQLNATVARLSGAKSIDEQRYRLFILLPAQQRCQSGENDVCISATEMAQFQAVMWQ